MILDFGALLFVVCSREFSDQTKTRLCDLFSQIHQRDFSSVIQSERRIIVHCFHSYSCIHCEAHMNYVFSKDVFATYQNLIIVVL